MWHYYRYYVLIATVSHEEVSDFKSGVSITQAKWDDSAPPFRRRDVSAPAVSAPGRFGAKYIEKVLVTLVFFNFPNKVILKNKVEKFFLIFLTNV